MWTLCNLGLGEIRITNDITKVEVLGQTMPVEVQSRQISNITEYIARQREYLLRMHYEDNRKG